MKCYMDLPRMYPTAECYPAVWKTLMKILSNYPEGLKRDDLTEITNFTRTRVHDNLAQMEYMNIVERYWVRNGRSRPYTYWRLKQ